MDLVLYQVDDNVHAAHEAGHVQRGQPALCGRLNGRARLQQQLHNLRRSLNKYRYWLN